MAGILSFDSKEVRMRSRDLKRQIPAWKFPLIVRSERPVPKFPSCVPVSLSLSTTTALCEEGKEGVFLCVDLIQQRE